MYSFDTIINRKNTNSLKYDFAVERNMPEDILPLWVADMDFKTPPEVINALVETSNYGIFGYSDTKSDYFEILKNWFKKFDWNIEQSWLIKTPGVVYAIATSVKAFTDAGDSVLIQRPVYYPFSSVINANKRKLINNSLVYKDGEYTIDFEDFETKIIKNNVKLFILCNPHNPVGRVWTKQELTTLGDICLKHNVIIVSDEIHQDFIYSPNKHIVLSNIKPEYKNITVTCTAPSKTFNLAGLQASNIFIPNPKLYKKFENEMLKTGYSQLNTLGISACMAAYKYGEDWLNELLHYLTNNLDYIKNFLAQNLPQIRFVQPQGTYLIWLDFKSLNLSQQQLDDLIINKAKLWLDSGDMFGEEGIGFQRINIACPRSILEKAFIQLKNALN